MTTTVTTTASELETHSVEFRAMGTDWYVEARGLRDETLAQTSVLVEREEQRCSRFRADSTLSLLNRERAVTDGRLALLASNALAIQEATDGAFDPAVGDAVIAAGYASDFEELSGTTVNAAEGGGRAALGLTVVGQDVRLEGAGQLDLGGIAKGWTADLVARYLRVLGWGCASTALAVNMHLFQVGGAADGYRGAGANEAPLRKVAEEGIILGSTGAEAIAAGAWSTPTTAVPDGDEYVINGHKYFCSQASAMNVVRVNAMDSETGEVLIVAIPASLPGVEVIETWDALGMRGTASHDVTFNDVRVPAAAVAPRLPADGPLWDPRFANVVKWFQSLMSGVYVGIADRAHEEALASVRGGKSNAARDLALTEALVGRLEMAHCGMEAAFDFGLRQVALAADPVAAMIVAVTMKDLATEAAVEVVDLAVQVTGGKAFFKKSVLERLARDVRAARHHPPSAPVSQQIVGKYLMGAGQA